MSIKIETYRGIDIMFEPTREKFFVEMGDDEFKEKSSYASTKTYIDEYLKKNQEFIPFKIISLPSTYGCTIHEIIGIRKDGRFITTRGGKPVQFSEYDEKSYVVYVPEIHDPILSKLEELKNEQNILDERFESVFKTFSGESLREIKSKYTV